MKLLMHLCCANCALHPLQSLLMKDIHVRGFWFNPNIHPLTEHDNRKESLTALQRLWSLDIAYEQDYRIDDYFTVAAGTGAARCEACYALRLERTADTAKRMRFDGFTTSLLVSPYQKFDKIVQVGNVTAKKYGIPFYTEDFRPGYRRAMTLSRELGLYRQKYCGCLYSETERQTANNIRRRS